MSDYSDVLVLSSVYLEDSYVMDVRVTRDTVTFVLEAVLADDHPRYQSPRPGEHYCYVSASLIFCDVVSLRWLGEKSRVFTDAAGEQDMGNIDSLKWENDRWRAVGDWGEVLIVTDEPPVLELHDQRRGW